MTGLDTATGARGWRGAHVRGVGHPTRGGGGGGKFKKNKGNKGVVHKTKSRQKKKKYHLKGATNHCYQRKKAHKNNRTRAPLHTKRGVKKKHQSQGHAHRKTIKKVTKNPRGGGYIVTLGLGGGGGAK